MDKPPPASTSGPTRWAASQRLASRVGLCGRRCRDHGRTLTQRDLRGPRHGLQRVVACDARYAGDRTRGGLQEGGGPPVVPAVGPPESSEARCPWSRWSAEGVRETRRRTSGGARAGRSGSGSAWACRLTGPRSGDAPIGRHGRPPLVAAVGSGGGRQSEAAKSSTQPSIAATASSQPPAPTTRR